MGRRYTILVVAISSTGFNLQLLFPLMAMLKLDVCSSCKLPARAIAVMSDHVILKYISILTVMTSTNVVVVVGQRASLFRL